MADTDALVIGGGIVGLACARQLAGRGMSVEVLEHGRTGGGASGAAAGMLAPLAEVPEPGAMFEACRAARDLWGGWVRELASEIGRRIDYDASGALVVARDEAETAELGRLLTAAGALGEGGEEVPVAEARRWVPDLASEVVRAARFPGDQRVDNRDATAALAVACRARGVVIRERVGVQAVRTATGGAWRVEARTMPQAGGERRQHAAERPGTPASVPTRGAAEPPSPPGKRSHTAGAESPGPVLHDDRTRFSRSARLVIVAAGAWIGGIAGLPPLPVRPVRGQMLRLEGVDWPWAGTVRAGERYAVRRGADDLLIGATVEEVGFADHPTLAGLAELSAFARELFPPLAGRPVAELWAGLRPATPDGLPLIGELPGMPGVVIAGGHFRNGILLAPWTAARVGELVAGEAPKADLTPFSPTRFAAVAPSPLPL